MTKLMRGYFAGCSLDAQPTLRRDPLPREINQLPAAVPRCSPLGRSDALELQPWGQIVTPCHVDLKLLLGQALVTIC